jgi:hypothetical protein
MSVVVLLAFLETSTATTSRIHARIQWLCKHLSGGGGGRAGQAAHVSLSEPLSVCLK